MIFWTNWTANRLQQYARARGLEVGIVFAPANAKGRYFVVSKDGKPMSRWASLGRTREDAEQALQHMAEAA